MWLTLPYYFIYLKKGKVYEIKNFVVQTLEKKL